MQRINFGVITITLFLLNTHCQLHENRDIFMQVFVDYSKSSFEQVEKQNYFQTMFSFDDPQISSLKNLMEFNEGCSDYIFGKCVNCNQGWYFDIISEQCISECGDNLIRKNEECEDGNFLEFDGCYHCKFSCPLNCQQCLFGQCIQENSALQYSNQVSKPKFQIITNDCSIECLDCQSQICYQCWNGWSLIDDQCQQICGDGLIAINSLEECDDGNNEIGDGCYDCKIEWCSPYCVDCVIEPYPICNRCQEYFEIVATNDCQPICGDGFIVKGLEECDDQNISKYDGCFDCHYICQDYCCNCYQGQCLDKCYYEFCYENFDSPCINHLLTSNFCSDMNNNFFERCYYEVGQCHEESQKHIFYRKCECVSQIGENLCFETCGNGIVDRTEECDDGNITNHDGCSSDCKIEFQNSEGHFNEIVSSPEIVLTFDSKYLDKQYLYLTFSNQVKLEHGSSSLQSSIQYQVLVEGELFQDVSFSLEPILEISTDFLRFPKYRLELKFLKYPNTPPKLNIRFNYDISITDPDQRVLYNFKIASIELKPVNERLILASKKCFQIGNMLIISLGVCSILIFLFGKFSDCLEILDVLQYQSFLRYINIVQPENLKCFFESFDQVAITPFLYKLKLFSFYSFTIGYRQSDSIGQFFQHKFNADLLSNIYGQISQIIGSIFILICLGYYKRYYYKKCFSEQYFNSLIKKDSKCLKYLACRFYFLNNQFFKIGKLMSQSGYRGLFLANVWDLTLKVLLFLASTNTYDFRNVVSYIFSMTYFIGLVFFLILHINRKNKYMALNQFYQQYFEASVVLKKVLFLIILIFFQFEPNLQSLLLTLVIILYISQLISIKKLINNFLDKIITIWIELPILIFTSITFCYGKDFHQYLSEDLQLKLAFLQISALIFGLIAPIFKHMIILINKLRIYCKQKQSVDQTQQIQKREIFFNCSEI